MNDREGGKQTFRITLWENVIVPIAYVALDPTCFATGILANLLAWQGG